ncbi:MAG: hypothetical protein ABJB12_24335 [Pseudomonadota bacterium]
MEPFSSLVTAAISGIVRGARTQGRSPLHSRSHEARASAADSAGSKHDCKGKNACKGQGGCKTDKHECKGQNDCKGQGGCNM